MTETDVVSIYFSVVGRPQQVGSKTPWLPRDRSGNLVMRNGRPVIATMDSNKKSKGWMQSVRDAAAAQLPSDFELLRGPVHVEVIFRFARPKGHFRSGKRANELKNGAPYWHVGTPDADKLCRSIGDGLSGVVIADDKQIAKWTAVKCYTNGAEGATIRITELI